MKINGLAVISLLMQLEAVCSIPAFWVADRAKFAFHRPVFCIAKDQTSFFPDPEITLTWPYLKCWIGG